MRLSVLVFIVVIGAGLFIALSTGKLDFANRPRASDNSSTHNDTLLTTGLTTVPTTVAPRYSAKIAAILNGPDEESARNYWIPANPTNYADRLTFFENGKAVRCCVENKRKDFTWEATGETTILYSSGSGMRNIVGSVEAGEFTATILDRSQTYTLNLGYVGPGSLSLTSKPCPGVARCVDLSWERYPGARFEKYVLSFGDGRTYNETALTTIENVNTTTYRHQNVPCWINSVVYYQRIHASGTSNGGDVYQPLPVCSS